MRTLPIIFLLVLPLLSSLNTGEIGAKKISPPAPADSVESTPKSFSYNEVQEHLTRHIEEDKPVVIHVMVALCDNENQGIVKVNRQLGNGQNPTTNLYWGAAYGVRTFLTRRAGYSIVRNDTLADQGILDRIILHKQIKRSGNNVDLYVVADAWDGAEIQQTTWKFLTAAAGYETETIEIPIPGQTDSTLTIEAGGQAQLLAYVGHNGLMDFRFSQIPVADTTAHPRSSIVLACASRPYFLSMLRTGGSHPLLLTTHLMAPEAYTLDAAISSFVQKKTTSQLHASVASAYNTYQKCGRNAARNLFSVQE